MRRWGKLFKATNRGLHIFNTFNFSIPLKKFVINHTFFVMKIQNFKNVTIRPDLRFAEYTSFCMEWYNKNHLLTCNCKHTHCVMTYPHSRVWFWFTTCGESLVGINSQGFLRFYLSDRKNILRALDYFIWMPRWSQNRILVYFDVSSKASLYCVLRDRWKNLRDRFLVAQTKTLSTNMFVTSTYAFVIIELYVLHCRSNILNTWLITE